MATALRHDGRRAGQMRPVRITLDFVQSAAGSCLIEVGRTRVICTASFTEGVPKWRKGSGLGWVTAEYGMLPASTGSRKPRPTGRQDGRSVEIQRLIGRVLRNVVRMDRLGENTVTLDCDVLDADGGTRTASITGAWVALDQAVARATEKGLCRPRALAAPVAGVSVGLVDGQAVLDLDYAEDASAQVDMNLAMTGGGKFVEIQGTAEGAGFDGDQLKQLLSLGRKGIRKLIQLQRGTRRKGRA